MRISTTAWTCVIIAAVALATVVIWNIDSPPPGASTNLIAPRSVDYDATRPKVDEFCGACHKVPNPELLPRRSWEEEIPKAYRRFKDSGRKDLIAPDQSDVIAYFVGLAPAAMVIRDSPPSAPGLLRFRTEVVELPENDESPGISFMNLTPSLTPADGVTSNLLLCDMLTGWLHLFHWEFGQRSDRPVCSLNFPCHIVPCDFDQDGRRDLLVANLGALTPSDHQLGSIVLLRSFEEIERPEVITISENLARVADAEVADLDGDGDNDVLAAEFGFERAGRLSWIETIAITNGKPQLQFHVIDQRHGAIHAQMTDLDHDGDLDVIALFGQEYESVMAYLNDGHGNFRPRILFQADSPGFGNSGMELVDLDRDGDQDILFTNGDSLDNFQLRPAHGVNWLENRGEGEFAYHRLVELPGAVRAVAADLDGDGDLDIAAVAFCPRDLRQQFRPKLLDTLIWLEQTAPGVFERHALNRTEAGHMAVAAGDFDGDGDFDLAVGEFSPVASANRSWFTIYWNQLRTADAKTPEQ